MPKMTKIQYRGKIFYTLRDVTPVNHRREVLDRMRAAKLCRAYVMYYCRHNLASDWLKTAQSLQEGYNNLLKPTDYYTKC